MTYQTPPQPGPFPPARPPGRPGLWNRLSPLKRVGLIAAVLVLPCCGGLTVIGALTGDRSTETVTTSEQLTDRQQAAANATDPAAATDATATATATATESTPPDPAAAPTSTGPAPAASSSAPPTATGPVVTTRTETKRVTIAFKTRRVNDADLAKGQTRVRTRGVDGVKTVTYAVTLTDGEPTARRVLRTVVTEKPVTKVIAVGTKERASRNCDPNYSPCVPIASDVDCAGGSGDGPAYVDGPIQVIGTDPYDLDRNDDVSASYS